jgi:muramoyltetrapeptide carboxypeptidase
MKRRHFLLSSGWLALGATATGGNTMLSMESEYKPRLIRPARLRPGANIGVIAPASPPAPDKFEKAYANLAAFGYKMTAGEHLYDAYGHLAGTDAQRVADIHWAFSNPAIDAVWCVRGGYGCTRLLPLLDFDLIRRHPKPFIGYSDITALHLAIHQKTGLVTFHGPVMASDFPENTFQHLRAVLVEPQAPYTVTAPAKDAPLEGAEYRPFIIHGGKARGALIGGNLALLSAMAGTEFSPSYKNKLVFMEDVGEQPYRIDRMLTQMLQATDLARAAGIVLGVFADCQPKGNGASLSLVDTLRDRLGNLGIPVFYGIPFGHVAHQMTFPYGIQAELDADAGTLTLLEKATV